MNRIYLYLVVAFISASNCKGQIVGLKMPTIYLLKNDSIYYFNTPINANVKPTLVGVSTDSIFVKKMADDILLNFTEKDTVRIKELSMSYAFSSFMNIFDQIEKMNRPFDFSRDINESEISYFNLSDAELNNLKNKQNKRKEVYIESPVTINADTFNPKKNYFKVKIKTEQDILITYKGKDTTFNKNYSLKVLEIELPIFIKQYNIDVKNTDVFINATKATPYKDVDNMVRLFTKLGIDKFKLITDP